VNDAERPQSFEEAQELSIHIRRAYLDYGFRLVELVASPVPNRLEQVLGCIEAYTQESRYG
jgi:predicted ATPase